MFCLDYLSGWFHLEKPYFAVKALEKKRSKLFVVCLLLLNFSENLFVNFVVYWLHVHTYDDTFLFSRHTVVCCAAQVNRVQANEASILIAKTKSKFSRMRSFTISYTNDTKFTV